MFKLEKYYNKSFDRQTFWEDKYAQEHIVGSSSVEFKKQGFWPLLQSSLTKDGKRYLDVGCGIGGWILFLKEEGYTVEGVDVAARTVRALTEYDPDLKVKVASMTALPYEDNSMDGVLAIGTLEYVEDKVAVAIAEVARAVKPGGLFFLEVPMANLLRRLTYIPMKKLEKIVRLWLGHEPAFSNYLFNRVELRRLLEEGGFEVTEERVHELPEPASHYGLYIDFPIFRGREQYKLNWLGRFVKTVLNAISPWIASTGMVVIAKKK